MWPRCSCDRVFHSRGVRSREALAEWIHSQGFPMPRWGAHFSARVQERILNITIATDARVSVFENLFVQLTLEECQGFEGTCTSTTCANESSWTHRPRHYPGQMVCRWRGSWGNVRAEVPSCRVVFTTRGRFRQAAQRALEARSHAVRTQDRQGEVRGWKLFCMMFVMLLRRDPGGQDTKEDLCHRFDLFVSGERLHCGRKLRGFRPSAPQTDRREASRSRAAEFRWEK